MEHSSDVVILGSGMRGLWLGTELVKLGWSVSWFQVHSPQVVKRKDDFVFDDWPWQIGPRVERSSFFQNLNEFIGQVFKPAVQDIAVQILTLDGPLEFSGPGSDLALRKFFPKTHSQIKEYFLTIKKLSTEPKGRKNLMQVTAQFFKRPSGQRWALEWLGALRRSRTLSTAEWVLNWEGDLLDPEAPLLLLNDGLDQVNERAVVWAEKKGVKIHRGSQISDIGVDGNQASGVEIAGGEGFHKCKRIILACSHQTALATIPRFAKHLEPLIKKDTEAFVWSRCGFYMKPNSRPSGLLEFSSFVIDPYMPFTGSNGGLLRWKTGVKGDSLTVWSKIPYAELKRRSYLMNLAEELEKNLGKLFPWFGQRLTAVFPFEEYFHSPQSGHDDLAIVFDKSNDFKVSKSRLKNVLAMGPGADRGLELLSRLATEYRLLGQLAEIRNKEIKRDRTLHPPRNGQSLVQSK